jgi:hypothetical protein
MRTQVVVRVLVFALALSSAASAFADVVTHWNTAALNAIRLNKTPPPRASRALAMLHVSIYDAVNGIERTNEPYFVRRAGPSGASTVAAASAAAHNVLAGLFPTSVASFDQLHSATLAEIRESPRKQRGVTWGETVAAEILAFRANDNSDALVLAPVGAGPGVWVPTGPAFAAFLLPQWGHVAPFAMPTGAHFRPLGPPALESTTYAQAYEEVKQFGGVVSTMRTAEQEQIALFWADGGGTETPPGHWNSIAQTVAWDRRNTMEENARLFALLNVAMADAAICAWEAKYTFNFWRPVTAIRNGDTDGNPATVADPTWTSLLGTPPFPDYVSGHSTFSGAASRVLAHFYKRNRIRFTTGSDFLPGVTRHFRSFSAAAAEAAVSRLYGGIHYRFANEDGMSSGVEIGDWVFTHVMTRRDRSHRSDDWDGQDWDHGESDDNAGRRDDR